MNNKSEFDIFQSKEKIVHISNDGFSIIFMNDNKNTLSLF